MTIDNKLDFDNRIEKMLKISGQKSYALLKESSFLNIVTNSEQKRIISTAMIKLKLIHCSLT